MHARVTPKGKLEGGEKRWEPCLFLEEMGHYIGSSADKTSAIRKDKQ